MAVSDHTEEKAMEWLMGLPVWLQALFATLFTYAMTALGASFVFLSGRIRRLF